jgi:hypothetical protein
VVRDDNSQVAIVVAAEAIVLDRVGEALHVSCPEGLRREAFGKFDTAQMNIAWALRHHRRFAQVDRADVLTSTTQSEFASVLESRRRLRAGTR